MVVPLLTALVVLAVVLTVVRLAGPDGGSTGSTAPGSAGSGASGASGSTGPGGDTSTSAPGSEPAGDLSPSSPAVPDPGNASRFTTVRPGADGESLEVTFWGGVEQCYEYTVRARESADTVTLSLDERVTFDGACIDMAQQYDRTVVLEDPLGARVVVDAVSGGVLLAPSP